MTAGSDRGAGQDGPDEIVQFGSSHSPLGRWLSRLLLGCLVVAAAIALAVHAGTWSPRPAGRPAHPPPPVNVITVGHPLLGVTASWELFARGATDLIRIQLARGRITRTFVPALETGNPQVSLLIGAHEAVIRSFDEVPGYVVPDGAQARVLAGPLAGGGPLVPGPGQQSAWIMSGPPALPALSLVALTGRKLGPTIRFQAGSPPLPVTAVSDGHGGVMLATTNYASTYDAGPGWDRLVTGTVAAVGPADWLVVTCRAQYRDCRNEVVDPATGARRVLSGPAVPGSIYFEWPPPGVTSPDGTTAAVPEPGRDGQMTVHLIRLGSGADRALSVPLAAAPIEQSMAWSPDSRWLFVAAAGGEIVAVNARSGRIESLGIALPPVSELAIRSAPAGTAGAALRQVPYVTHSDRHRRDRAG